MTTRLIALSNGILVEAEIIDKKDETISSNTIKEVKSTFDKIKPILIGVSRPITEVWKELSQNMFIESAEIEVNFCFESEGNIYITKAKAGANLSVKLVLKPEK